MPSLYSGSWLLYGAMLVALIKCCDHHGNSPLTFSTILLVNLLEVQSLKAQSCKRLSNFAILLALRKGMFSAPQQSSSAPYNGIPSCTTCYSERVCLKFNQGEIQEVIICTHRQFCYLHYSSSKSLNQHGITRW